MPDSRIAGVRCSEVLAELSDFLDGQLTPERTEQLKAHVLACDVCERFGADVKSAVELLRKERAPEALSDDLSKRLADRLRSL